MPKSSPVTSEMPSAKNRTRASSTIAEKRNRKDGSPTSDSRSRRESDSTPQREKRTPATPPARESTRLSVRSWRTIRRRAAPMATRIATSRPRADSPGQQERGHVGASDQEDEGDGPEEDDHGAAEGRIDPAVVERSGRGAPHRAADLHRVLLRDLCPHELHFGRGRAGRDAPFEAGDDVVPVVAVLLQDVGIEEDVRHRHRDPDVGVAGEPREARGRDADDRHGARG